MKVCRNCGRTVTECIRRLPEYSVYSDMIRRCDDPKRDGFHNYGGRGITVCSEWRKCFHNFYFDVGPRPTNGHTIDRINNDGNYEPRNIRWATRREQCINRRHRPRRYISLNGKIASLKKWADVLGIGANDLSRRIKRMGIEKALTKPVRHKNRHFKNNK